MKSIKHKNLLIGLHQSLDEVFNHNKSADKVLESLFKSQRRWGSKDRKWVAESFYDIIRWKRMLAFYIDEKQAEKHLYAIIAAYFLKQGATIPYWPEFATVPFHKIKKRLSYTPENNAIALSYPDEFIQKLTEENVPDFWEELDAMNSMAPLIIRVNTLKTSKENVQEALEKDEIEVVPVSNPSDALCIPERENIFTTQAFKDGWFEVQDANSQQVAICLDPKPGERVLDACAGAGGKTLHIAALMENKGTIIAHDEVEWKLKNLKSRAKRAGAFNVQAKKLNSSQLKRYHASFDKVLIDAPCSGSGVIRRNPDSKWRMNATWFAELEKLQEDVLQQYSPLVKSGGRLVYATCSILPSENQSQVKKFLQTHADYALEKEVHLSPKDTGYDGFYIAVLTRK